jgi:hypothetical protein
MSDPFEPEKVQNEVESRLENASHTLHRVGNRLVGDARKIARDNVPYLLIGAVVVLALIGLLIAQREEQKVRDRWADNFRRDAADWLTRHGRKVTEPIREQIEHVADRAAGYGLSFSPKRRKFLNLF